MPQCEEAVYDEEVYDFLMDRMEVERREDREVCVQPLDQNYDAVYYRPQSGDPALNITDYTYNAIPRCFMLLDQSALLSSGVLRVRDQPNLALTGRGVLFGIIDTGFDYRNPAFQYSDGSTRIVGIWDQRMRDGQPPSGFLYGTEYTRVEINEALAMEEPSLEIPAENGHGTFLAALAAGSVDEEADFSGVAPECDLAFVQLKPAKQYLREFYFIPQQTPVFQENDIMAGITYLEELAARMNQPLVICLALGTNMGNRDGNGPLELGLETVARRRQRCVVIAAGNEANRRHHFLGNITDPGREERVEISVTDNSFGFDAELWAMAPEQYEVTVLSPTGERFLAVPSLPGNRSMYQFLFEKTVVTVDYQPVGYDSNSQLIFLTFARPVPGIWTILVRVKNYVDGRYHIWLPMEGMSSGEVIFLRSNPDTTITVPSAVRLPICVGGYDTQDNSIYYESGRGYPVTGSVKPDFVAPAVDVYGPVDIRRYGVVTGTSAAAAITAGTCAMVLEWTGVRRNELGATTATIKNFLIRGAAREGFREYPNREWGWGRLDIYQAFESLRNL